MTGYIRAASVSAMLMLSLPALAQQNMPTKEMVIAGMVSEGATEEQATCFLDALGDDWLRIMGSMGPNMAQEDMTKLREAMTSCGIQPPPDEQ